MIDWIVLKEAKKQADIEEAAPKEKEGAGVALKKSLAAWTAQKQSFDRKHNIGIAFYGPACDVTLLFRHRMETSEDPGAKGGVSVHISTGIVGL